jgi:hypothetical protein
MTALRRFLYGVSAKSRDAGLRARVSRPRGTARPRRSRLTAVARRPSPSRLGWATQVIQTSALLTPGRGIRRFDRAVGVEFQAGQDGNPAVTRSAGR